MTRHLVDTVECFNVRKQEHRRQEQNTPSNRDENDGDLATMDHLLSGTGVTGHEADVQGARITDVMLRDLDRACLLRGTNRKVLRSVLFTMWMDGLSVGLLHGQAVGGEHVN